MQTPRAKVRLGLSSVAIAIAMSVPALAVAEKKPEPPPVDTIQGLQVGLPVFAEKDGEWRMIITATGPLR